MKILSRWSVLLLLAAAPALAVVLPLRIPFQGKLIDPATNNPRNGSFSMQFKLYTAPTGGVAVFTETQQVGVTNGVFSVQIGTIALLSPDLFSGASAYLGVTVGADAEMLPRQPLSMSPYAFTAMQLVSNRDVRVNSENAYSTFTTAGNWEFPYGVTAGSAAITGNAFSVGTSSFVVAGGSATVGYRAQAGSFLATGPNGFFVGSSSITTGGGLFGAGATISGNSFSVGASSFVVGGGSATVGYSLTASNVVATASVTANAFFGDATNVTNPRPEISTFVANGSLALAAGTEVFISSVPITPSATNSIIQITGLAMFKMNAAASNIGLKIRKKSGSVCNATTDAIVFASSTSATVANMPGQGYIIGIDAPNSITQQWYCMTAQGTTAAVVSSRTIIVSEFR